MSIYCIKNLILDMDGVLWRGETPMPGLTDFFTTLRHLDIGFVLATNNATKTAEQYAGKLARFGVEISPAQILTSAEATAGYLSERYPPDTAVYVVGENGLRNAMETRAFRLISAEEAAAGALAELVVVGFTRHATYMDLAMGALLIHKGAAFIGTNPDVSYPSELGPLPGAGSLLAMISAATGVQPAIIGKPGPIIFREALKRLGGSPDETAMVGDRLSTDIAGGNAAALHTILLLSGISSPDDIETTGIIPDMVLEDITALAEYLTQACVSVNA
ncbi:MAG: HAD-IIA family hydrolase [Anaerolineae bacterium]